MSTPFDVESAKFLNEMMDVIKISSSDITNRPFIEFLCEFNKPIILSTGASNIDEIYEAVEWISSKKVPLVLLQCVLNYPTADDNANLGMIKDLQKRFPNNLIGYSDHTLPGDMRILEIATLLGASILEKHFTHDKNLPGNDHYHAMDKDDLKIFNANLKRTFSVIGSQEKFALQDEDSARLNARRSLVAACNIDKGQTISKDHLTWKRPAHGVSPRDIDNVLGMRALRQIKEDELINWEMLSPQ
jgi:N-acetylneuraminate synthase